MKKQLFLTALMSVTAFSAQASIGLAAKTTATAVFIAAEGYVVGLTTPDHIRHQILGTMENFCNGVGKIVQTIFSSASPTIVPTIIVTFDKQCVATDAHQTVLAGALAATAVAAAHYGMKRITKPIVISEDLQMAKLTN